MPWASSNRRARLPRDWAKRVGFVKGRARGRCEWLLESGERCSALGSQCDHIINDDNHALTNLQWLCVPHHKLKTQQESLRAQEARRAETIHPSRKLPHPGSL